jgi:NAD(P)H-hydrate epimerase
MSRPTETVTSVPRLPARPADAHKGTFGTALVVAGSVGMSGAAVLAGTGALRGGAGLVRVATPEPVCGVVAGGNPCYMTVPLPADGQGRTARAALPLLLEQAAAVTAVAVGPGLGHTDETAEVVRGLVTGVSLPLLLDADALNVLGPHPAVLRQRAGPTVLTPHPGEFARLTDQATAGVQADRVAQADAFTREFGVVLVLKGAGTVVADGARVYVNTTGNPGMATGGAGDVLSGLLAALLAQRMEPFAAAVLAVYLHGLAGDLARTALGGPALIATDLLAHLPAAFGRHAAAGEREA